MLTQGRSARGKVELSKMKVSRINLQWTGLKVKNEM